MVDRESQAMAAALCESAILPDHLELVGEIRGEGAPARRPGVDGAQGDTGEAKAGCFAEAFICG